MQGARVQLFVLESSPRVFGLLRSLVLKSLTDRKLVSLPTLRRLLSLPSPLSLTQRETLESLTRITNTTGNRSSLSVADDIRDL